MINRTFRHKGYVGMGASLMKIEDCGVCNLFNLAVHVTEAVYAAEVEWLDQQRYLWRKEHTQGAEGEGA